jgi:diguanylate cyclase (GGDEF)-like protein
MSVAAWIDTLPPSRTILYSLLLCLLVAILDYLTGYKVHVALLYILPILLVSWAAGRTMGFVLSVLAAGSWFVANSLTWPSDVSRTAHFWNAGVRLITFLASAHLISALKETRGEALQSRIDPLTGAGNLREFRDRAAAEIIRSRRYQHPLTVAYLDLDNFKAVNDRFGHATGDEVLCTVVGTLRRNIRESDLLTRVGGDEFLLLFPETKSEAAPKAVQKMEEMLEQVIRERQWPVTASIGVVTFITPPESVDELLKVADRAMYSAKAAGKNRIAIQTYGDGTSTPPSLQTA